MASNAGAAPSSNLIPERYPLAHQVSEILVREIRRGTWKHWLPAERSLCATIQVSRNTLRKALQQLEKRGVLEVRHGHGHKIVKATGKRAAKDQPLIGLIVPVALHELRPRTSLWIDELRGLLYDAGCRLNVYEGRQYLGGERASVLRKLTQRTRHACWILVMANQRLQRWAEKNRLPCIVAGSVWPGIDLPSIDVDNQAICRHATLELIRLGHRRIVFFLERSDRAGERESEIGFLEGVGSNAMPDLRPQVVIFEQKVESVCKQLAALFDQKPRPTALLVSNSHYYLTVMGYLLRRGLRVPEDVSVICRDDDPFLAFVVPPPSRYVYRPHVFARRLIRSVLQMTESAPVVARKMVIVPEFFRGGTVAAL
jgi:LacI family transcriptional regulator